MGDKTVRALSDSRRPSSRKNSSLPLLSLRSRGASCRSCGSSACRNDLQAEPCARSYTKLQSAANSYSQNSTSSYVKTGQDWKTALTSVACSTHPRRMSGPPFADARWSASNVPLTSSSDTRCGGSSTLPVRGRTSLMSNLR